MGSLFTSLQTASTALDVYSRALGNEAANVSNAGTDGYAALKSRIATIGSYGPPAGTDDYISLSPSGNVHADALVRAASSQAAASSTTAGQLTPLVSRFDITGTSGILAAFQNFSGAFSRLSLTPNDSSLQAAALAAAANVAQEFHTAAAQVDSQRFAADSDATQVVARINQLGSQIRQYNVQTRAGASATSGVDAGLRSALDELSTLVDIGVSTNNDGTVSVLAGGQQPLVLDDQVFTLSLDLSAAPRQQVTSTGGGGSPASYGGTLGALLDFRNVTAGSLVGGNGVTGSLNDLAVGFGARVNALLTSGVTANGSPGVPLFTWDPLDPTNVARTIAVDPAVVPAQLASGNSTASNGTADALGKLVSSTAVADQIGGQSAERFFAGIGAGIGRQLADARNLSNANQTALTAAQADRQTKSGVSLDEAAINITAYQRAYQANAKVISIVNELTADVVGLIK